MAQVTLKGTPFHTLGDMPKIGSEVKEFTLTKLDLSNIGLSAFAGKRKILNIFPSVDTPVCAASVRKFNEKASSLKNTLVLCISADLPFAMKRFCGAEGISSVESLSSFRTTFAKDIGVEIADGPFKGLCARSVIVLDENNKVLHSELVSEIANEPNYEAALLALK